MNNTDNAARTGQVAQSYELQHLRHGPYLARRLENGALFLVASFVEESDLAEHQQIVRACNSHDALVEALEAMLATALKCDDAAWSKAIERSGANRPCDMAMAALALAKGGQQ